MLARCCCASLWDVRVVRKLKCARRQGVAGQKFAHVGKHPNERHAGGGGDVQPEVSLTSRGGGGDVRR